jgi:hypothetical protein
MNRATSLLGRYPDQRQAAGSRQGPDPFLCLAGGGAGDQGERLAAGLNERKGPLCLFGPKAAALCAAAARSQAQLNLCCYARLQACFPLAQTRSRPGHSDGSAVGFSDAAQYRTLVRNAGEADLVVYSRGLDQIPIAGLRSLALAGFSVLFVVETELATAWHRTPRPPMSATKSAPRRRLHSS